MEINDLIGIWENESNNKLVFEKKGVTNLKVSFISGESGVPVKRTFYRNKESSDMNATVDSYYGEIEIELWEKGKGFSLLLNYDYSVNINDSNGYYPLSPSISRNEEDDFLDKYIGLFEPLQKYYKLTGETK